MSRAELARALHLDAKSLTNLARQLIKEGFLATTSLPTQGRGRPPEGLRLRVDSLIAIAAEIHENKIVVSPVDLDGRTLSRFAEPIPRQASQQEIIRIIRQITRMALDRAPFRPLGIGVSYPGVLNLQRGTIVECSQLKCLENVRMDLLFHDFWDGHISYVETKQAFALAERSFGSARQLDDFLLLHLGKGIGCVFMSEGRLRNGHLNTAGEIGHTVIDPKGTLCGCGRRGCLETVASLESIFRHALPEQGGLSVSPDPRKIAALASQGDPAAIAAIQRAAHAVGLVLATLVNAFGPSHLVLSGESLQFGEMLIAEIETSVRRYALPSVQKGIELRVSSLGSEAACQGAAAAVFQSLFTA